jgi:hypothetical protein
MSNLYLKVKDVQLIETREFDAFSEEPKIVKHWLIKTDFANSDISVKVNPDKPKIEVVNLDEHDKSIGKLLLSICKMSYDSLESAFGARNLENILREHTISEIQKMYDDWKKPKVGDEVQVLLARTFTGIVIGFKKYGDTEYVVFLAKNGIAFSECPLPQAIKTGRHFDNISIETLAEYVGV